jgi:hypothetical protein
LGVPNRLEKTLVGDRYFLHTIPIEGFQQRFGLKVCKNYFPFHLLGISSTKTDPPLFIEALRLRGVLRSAWSKDSESQTDK